MNAMAIDKGVENREDYIEVFGRSKKEEGEIMYFDIKNKMRKKQIIS